VILALLVWAICGTAIAGYYSTQYNTYQNEYNNLLAEINLFSRAIENLTGAMGNVTGSMGNLSDVMSSLSLRVNILVSYGNGTRTWFNNTALPLGTTAFTALRLVTSDVNYTDYGGNLGILVTSINGLANNPTLGRGWFFWSEPAETTTWTLPNYSCAQLILHREDTIAFTYQSYNPWPTSPS
jgi:hypothetical protein